jgi:ABC-type glycerol-3-phosphate transport system substrate-binding protein
MKRTIFTILAVVCVLTLIAACSPAATQAPADTSAPAQEAAPAEDAAPAEESAPAEEAPAEKIEIVTWHTLTDHHQAAYDSIIADFNASQDKYVVVAQQQTYAEYDAKLMQAVSTGSAPDFVSMFPSQAINFIEDGYLYDMSAFINDPEIGMPNFEADLAPGVLQGIKQWGINEIYLIPDAMTGEVLFYNKTWLDELGLSVPTTWSELETVSKAIYETYGVPGFGTDSIVDTYQALVMQAGSDYIDVDTKSIAIDRQIGIDKLNWFANGVKEGYFRLVGEDFYFSNPFGSQAVGMYIGSSAGVDYVYAAIPAEGEAGHFEVGAAPIPQEGPAKYIGNWSYGHVCLSRDEEHARGVYEFLKYYTSTPVAVGWSKSFGSSPVFKGALEDPEFVEFTETNIALKALTSQIQYAGFLPSIYGADTVRTEIDKMVQSVALGVSDAETAFDAFVEASNAALQN